MTRTRTLLSALALLAVTLCGSVAYAQATVVVQVRTAEGEPAEATVTLTPREGGAPYSCRTSNGTCRMSGVPAGRYIVTAQPISGGRAPIPRPIPIPPGGEVTVSVTLR